MTRIYREDIDWLRAIAVLSVLAFHWGVPPFRGGYVGVDIFFVISGFLIAQIIQSEMQTGRFSFARFYERRMRRLLPALYVMIVLVVLPSFYLLLGSERQEMFRSITAVVTFTSNFFFWRQTGYFAPAADEKPLLHTWSLSVEEQFYLVLPLLVWGLLRWQGRTPGRSATTNLLLVAGLGIAALASFALSHWLMTSGRTATAFFMSPARAWEFLAGSLVAIEGIPVLRNQHLRRIARGVGLAMIAIPVVAYREGTSFPGAGALLPCAGTAIFIWSGIGSGAVKRSAHSPLGIAGFFGKISYSLYLWHWPLFIYAKFLKTNLSPGPVEKAVLFGVAVALSYASYRFVEQPLRRGELLPARRTAFAVAGVTTIIILLGSGLGMMTSGTSQLDSRAKQLEAYNSYVFPPSYRGGVCSVEHSFNVKACLTMVEGKTNVLLWGDSLAAHYIQGLISGTDAARVNMMQATAEGCFPALAAIPKHGQSCKDQVAYVAAFLAQNKPDLVIMSAHWVHYARVMGFDAMMVEVQRSLSEFSKLGIQVLVVGQSIEFKSRLPSMLRRAEIRKIDPLLLRDLVVPSIFTMDSDMKSALKRRGNINYVSVVDRICPEQNCPVTLAGGAPLTWDKLHLTPEGSDFIGGYIAKFAKLPGSVEEKTKDWK